MNVSSKSYDPGIVKERASESAMLVKVAAQDAGGWEHNPIMCGTSEETDCPLCVIKFWPLRRQNDLAHRLEETGIDYIHLAELMLRTGEPKIERLIAQVIDRSLRQQQISLLDALYHRADRETLRVFFRDLLADDMVAVAEAVFQGRKKRGRKIRASA